MSDLADAVFGGQLTGHVIAGEELTREVIRDAAIKANIADNLVVDNDLSPIEQQILEAKVAQATASNEQYLQSDITQDVFETHFEADIAESFFS